MQTTYFPPSPATQPPPPPPPPQDPTPTEVLPAPSPKRPIVRSAALAALLAVAAGVGGVAGAVVADDRAAGSTPASSVVRDASPAAADDSATNGSGSGSIETAAARVGPSVVTIEVQSSSGPFGSASSATGSGVIIRADGYILTNNHVVSSAVNGGASITVTFNDGRTASARIVGRDPSSDLAVIKVQGISGLTAATFANSDQLRIGQSVIAVGAPLGLSNTVTSGIVSAVGRPVRTGENGVDQQSAVIDAIQTDTAINPGNSGGPLVDLSGRVVGINSAIATVGESNVGNATDQSGNIGVGFAIPANDAADIADQLIAHGTAEHASLGVQASDADAAGGAVIRQVTSGSPADDAGLRAGDLVTRVGDRKVTDVDSLVVAIRDHAPGDHVVVTYRRGGQEEKATVTLTSQSVS
jgi:putative serine protease PepD